MKIPQNPQIPSADVMEKFLNGEKPPDKPSKKIIMLQIMQIKKL